ncbi:hypothetical protein IFM89_025579 [Coptis chinensis]|uniref:Uncharacterized protein n=1 Tax=Coptis chinensis TaxID=261450 RepID=A0A835M6M8_9MAGN|nr:hypothetical protein IFM89_025579 [Coptis chinensis]
MHPENSVLVFQEGVLITAIKMDLYSWATQNLMNLVPPVLLVKSLIPTRAKCTLKWQLKSSFHKLMKSDTEEEEVEDLEKKGFVYVCKKYDSHLLYGSNAIASEFQALAPGCCLGSEWALFPDPHSTSVGKYKVFGILDRSLFHTLTHYLASTPTPYTDAWTSSHCIRFQSLQNHPPVASFLANYTCLVPMRGVVSPNSSNVIKVVIHLDDELLFYDLSTHELRRIGRRSKDRKLTRPHFFHSNTLVALR